MAQSCVLQGNLIGAPQVVSGCEGSNSAACSTPTSTIYALATTTTNKVVGVPIDTTNGKSTTLPSIDFSFTPTTDGFYSLSYKGTLITLDLATGQLILATSPSPVKLDLKYGQTGASSYLQIRVSGNYTYSVDPVPVFSSSTTPTTSSFALGARLASISGTLCIVPVLISLDAALDASKLPGSFCLVDWSAIGVISNTIVAYPLTTTCAGNTTPDTGPAPSSWGDWIWLIVLIVLIILVFVIAYFLRRTEYVHDPRLPLVLAAIGSR